MEITPHGNLAFDLRGTDVGTFHLTPERIRDIAKHRRITSGPGSDETYMPTSLELEALTNMVTFAVDRGQVFDFGYWPNEMIQLSSNRAGRLYTQDALGHPFSTPYIILHTWDDKQNENAQERIARLQKRNKAVPESSAYLVNPFPLTNGKLCTDFEILQFDAITIKGMQFLAVGDRALFLGDESSGSGEYFVRVVPYAYRFPELMDNKEFARMVTNSQTDNILQAAASNLLDPFMTALLILNTNGVEQKTVTHEKINRIRKKQGKTLFPDYRRVNSATYVTAILAKAHREKASLGGTHASPVMHVRSGHWRNYKSGEKSFIRDTLVNATPEMREQFVSKRSHYVVRK